eukprot:scaffold20527_cov24-Tisochrysis_lutea.AAC.4
MRDANVNTTNSSGEHARRLLARKVFPLADGPTGGKKTLGGRGARMITEKTRRGSLRTRDKKEGDNHTRTDRRGIPKTDEHEHGK